MCFSGGFLLVCCLLCSHFWAASPADTSLEERSCSDPASTEVCFEASVPYKVALQTGESAVLRCVIRNLSKQVVTWMKNDGRDIPMTIGKTVFTPDKRISLDNSIADEWNLVIRLAQVNDSGEYLCQVNGRTGLMARAYGLVVEESQQSSRLVPPVDNRPDQKGDKRLLNDDQEARSKGKSPAGVSISGEGIAFEGTRYFPLTCSARFASRDAKVSSRVAIEWYHQGMRQAVNVSSMDISMSWTDSDRAVSVLTIYRVQMSHTGEWVCLKRPSELGAMETATHTLTVLARDSPVVMAADSSAVSPASLGIRGEKSRSSGGCQAALATPPELLLLLLLAAVTAASSLTTGLH